MDGMGGGGCSGGDRGDDGAAGGAPGVEADHTNLQTSSASVAGHRLGWDAEVDPWQRDASVDAGIGDKGDDGVGVGAGEGRGGVGGGGWAHCEPTSRVSGGKGGGGEEGGSPRRSAWGGEGGGAEAGGCNEVFVVESTEEFAPSKDAVGAGALAAASIVVCPSALCN